MDRTTVSAAYGRNYRNASEALTAWKDGLDFIIQTVHGGNAGRLCSIRDTHHLGQVSIRYNEMRDIVAVPK